MNEPNFPKVRILRLERRTNSAVGSPRWRVRLSNGVIATTHPDASINYQIENSEMKGDVDVWLTEDGWTIEDIRPCVPAVL